MGWMEHNRMAALGREQLMLEEGYLEGHRCPGSARLWLWRRWPLKEETLKTKRCPSALNVWKLDAIQVFRSKISKYAKTLLLFFFLF